MFPQVKAWEEEGIIGRKKGIGVGKKKKTLKTLQIPFKLYNNGNQCLRLVCLGK